MGFKKGDKKPEGSGRKRGVKNKKTLLRAEDVLTAQGCNPIEKIIDLIPYLEPEDQLKAWLDLHKFVEAQKKPKDEGKSEALDAPGTDLSGEPLDPAQLLQLVKQ